MDILDDFMNEAHQVHKHNKWLDYALPLDLCREMEFHEQTFDTLDGRTLTRGELIEFFICFVWRGESRLNRSCN